MLGIFKREKREPTIEEQTAEADAVPLIKEIRRYNTQPGDVLLVTLPKGATDFAKNQASVIMNWAFRDKDVKIVFTQEGYGFQVIRAPDVPEVLRQQLEPAER